MEKKIVQDKIDLRKYFSAIKKSRMLYVISFSIAICLSVVYGLRFIPSYESYTTILIDDDKGKSSGLASLMGGGASKMLSSLAINGLGASSSADELLILNSIDTYVGAVKKTNYNISYTERSGLARNVLYEDSPVKLVVPAGVADTLDKDISFIVKMHGGKADVKAAMGFLGHKTLAEKEDATFPVVLKTSYGEFAVDKTEFYEANADTKVVITLSNPFKTAVALGEKYVKVDDAEKSTSGITLSIKDFNKARGEAFLAAMVETYNEVRTDRRAMKARAEVDFYDQRIAALSGELSEAEKNVQEFKEANRLTDVATDAEMLIRTSAEVRHSQLEVETRYEILKMMQDFIKNPENRYSMIPMSEGLGDQSASKVLSDYNDLIARKISIERTAKPGNPALKELCAQIDAFRQTAEVNVSRLINNAKSELATLSAEHGRNTGRLGSLPAIERKYVDLERNREIKNALYLFLLEQRESSMLSITTTTPPAFVIESPYSDIKPSYVKLIIVVLILLCLAFFVPTYIAMRRVEKHGVISELFDLPYYLENRAVMLENNSELSLVMANFDHYMPDAKTVWVASYGNPDLDRSVLLNVIEGAGRHMVPVIDESKLYEYAAAINKPEGALLILVKRGCVVTTEMLKTLHYVDKNKMALAILN